VATVTFGQNAIISVGGYPVVNYDLQYICVIFFLDFMEVGRKFRGDLVRSTAKYVGDTNMVF
jgi:hypothetical protein